MLTDNYLGNFYQSKSLNFTGTALVFLNLNCLLIDWLSNILVNDIGEPYVIYMVGFDPKHLSGSTRGFGLFLIMIIN